MTEPLNFDEFAPTDLEAWAQKVDEAKPGQAQTLGGTLDDLGLAPVYPTRAAVDCRAPSHAEQSLRIACEYTLEDPLRLGAALRSDDAYGLEAAWIRLHPTLRSRSGAAQCHRGGVHLTERNHAHAIVDAVEASTQLWVDAGTNALSTFSLMLEASAEGVRNVGVLSDPLGAWLETGVLGVSVDDALADQAKLVARAKVECPSQRVVLASGVPMHDAGATAAVEIGCIVASAVEYVRALTERGHSAADVVDRLVLRCSVDSDVFESLAKVRALRHLWNRVCTRIVGEPRSVPLSVRSGWRNRTRDDPWSNMLRATVETFAAMTGGASEVCIQPFSEVVGTPAEDARRWAIATGILLREESHLGSVVDPAAGSGYVEAMTDALARQAWRLVRDIERAGGMALAIDKGLPQKKIAASAHERRQVLARSKKTLTGVTLYPDLGEKAPSSAPVVECVEPDVPEANIVENAMHLEARRLAEPFEALRDGAGAYRERSGAWPMALIVEVGARAGHRARLDFVRSAVAVGGFEPSVAAWSDGPPGLDAHVRLVVLCGADEALESEGPAVAAALRTAGAPVVLVAASPRSLSEALRESADGFLHTGTEIISVMSDLHSALGVTP